MERERLAKEDEQRRVKSYKTQNQTAKQQLAELQMRQSEEQRRLDRLVDDLRLAKERATVAESASERLQAELMSLKEMNDDVRMDVKVALCRLAYQIRWSSSLEEKTVDSFVCEIISTQREFSHISTFK